MRLSMTSLKAADAKDVASSVTAIANEKLKAEKEANAGKKKTGISNTSFTFSLIFPGWLVNGSFVFLVLLACCGSKRYWSWM